MGELGGNDATFRVEGAENLFFCINALEAPAKRRLITWYGVHRRVSDIKGKGLGKSTLSPYGLSQGYPTHVFATMFSVLVSNSHAISGYLYHGEKAAAIV